MISKEIQDAINKLIQLEQQSAHLYLAMSVYFNRVNMKGFAHWLQLQYDEERGHALKLMNYLIDRGGTVELLALPEQPVNFGTPLEAFQRVLAHEQFVTNNYQQAYDFAQSSKDIQSSLIFQEFLREQVDEEAQAAVIIGRLQMAGSDASALLMIDQELGQRKE